MPIKAGGGAPLVLKPYNFSKAARLIKKVGWWQGGTGTGPKGEICLTTAVVDTIEQGESFADAFDRLWLRLGENPEAWNDHQARTKKEVLDLLYNL